MQNGSPVRPATNGAVPQSRKPIAGEMGLEMPEGKIYKFFLGANSPDGFYSLYNRILDPDTASEIYIVKGGPGGGKSSFMQLAGSFLTDAGFTAEHICCPADPDSLDGILFPEIGLAFVDGTRPHAVVRKIKHALKRPFYQDSLYICCGVSF